VDYLTLDDVLQIAARVLDGDVRILMPNGLKSAVARPQAMFEGKDLHPSIHHKAAALMDSLTNNHGLADGNKRLALASVIVFYALNGYRLDFNNEEAYEFTQAVAISLRDIDAIARVLAVAAIFSTRTPYRRSRSR
jgi:death on curing protein